LNQKIFCQLAVEGEIAIRIGSNGDIESASPVIELHNFIFRAEKKTLSKLIGNNGFNAGTVFPDFKYQQSKKILSRIASLAIEINDVELGIDSLWPKEDGH
jgi:hypothetical protein